VNSDWLIVQEMVGSLRSEISSLIAKCVRGTEENRDKPDTISPVLTVFRIK